jgi:GAF domain-containing protein
MNEDTNVDVLRGAALQGVVNALLEQLAAARCTLRLDVPGDVFPVVYEARRDGARTLIGDQEVTLRGQPVVEAMLSGTGQVVQHDSARASEDPAFQRMLRSYGGLGAQIVTAVRPRGVLRGIVSVHHLGGPRNWTEAEIALASDAARLAGRVLDDGAREPA